MASFTIESAEGLAIRGEFDSPAQPRALVLVVHGFKGFKDWGFFPWLGEFLSKRGFAVCRFNMSRSGIGENPETFDRLDLFADDTYSIQIADLLTVAAHARSRFPTLPLFLLGHSRGGGISILAAREIRELRGIVTWSAISRVDRYDEPTLRQWRSDGFMDVMNARTKQVMRMSTRMLDDMDANPDRLDILGNASRLETPMLIVHGARDESVPSKESHEIAAAARDATHLIIGTASHTYNAIHPLVHVPPALRLAADVTAHFVGGYC